MLIFFSFRAAIDDAGEKLRKGSQSLLGSVKPLHFESLLSSGVITSASNYRPVPTLVRVAGADRFLVYLHLLTAFDHHRDVF